MRRYRRLAGQNTYCAAVLALVLTGVAGGHGKGCPTPTAADLAKIRAYVAARYELAPDLGVEDEGPLKGTCFRLFTVRATAPKRSLVLYASPDLRFLTETPFDTTTDPTKERQWLAAETQKALVADESPSRGSNDAPVTIVVFSDFQCPFCKRFEDLAEALPADDAARVRIIFKHLPLQMHKWARPAAEFAACAELQAPGSFWRLHDFLMANQTSLTAEALGERIEAFSTQEGLVDTAKLRECVNSHGADPVLLRDELLARLYHVDSTPTIFINGVRSPSFHSAEELGWAVRRAVLERKPKSEPTR